MICNIVENSIHKGNKNKIDKKQLVCDCIQQLFCLQPQEIEAVKNQIDYLFNNKLIKKIPFLTKSYKFIKSYFF